MNTYYPSVDDVTIAGGDVLFDAIVEHRLIRFRVTACALTASVAVAH